MPNDLKVYEHLTGGIGLMLNGFSTFGTLGVVLEDDKEGDRKFLVTAFHVIFGPKLLQDGVKIWQPLDPNQKGKGPSPNKLCDWPAGVNFNNPRGRVRQPNLCRTVPRGETEDYCAIELDTKLPIKVAEVRDIGEITPYSGTVSLGLEVRMRGAASGQSTFGVVEDPQRTLVGSGGNAIRDCILVRLSDTGPKIGVPTFSQDGDSGSLVVTKSGHHAIGILKGLDPASNLSIVYPMDRVLRNCGLKL